MAYKREWRPSPNFTPNAQTRAFYGRPRTIEIGAGHWWDDPSRQPSHSGVVNTFLNPARQASAHAVVSAGLVTEMVRQEDTAWCTNSANPYTFAIECDPRIVLGGQAAENIMATLAEYIADKGFHNLPWKPHKAFFATACNPINWDEVRRRAQVAWQAKYGAPTPTPTPTPPANANIEWIKLPSPVEYVANRQPTKLWNFNQTGWGGFGKGVKDFNKGDRITIYGKAINKTLNATYLVTEYSFNNRITNGFNQTDLVQYVAPTPPPPVVVVPEWQKNLVPITPIKLMVLPTQTPIVNLNDLSIIKQLGQGTWIDFTKKTIVQGKEFLISSYSDANAMPNGILRSDVGEPAAPPVNEKPEWLNRWQDIADVVMYTRVDADLVNFADGKTIKKIPRGTPIDVSSTTELHARKYAITVYSTEKQQWQGILLDDLDMKKPADEPATPSPTQPTIEENVNWLVKAVKAILAKLGINV